MYVAHYARLVVLVTSVCDSTADAEEAVQEAFARALVHDLGDERIIDPLAWLYRVARNVTLSRFRRVARALKHAPVLRASEHAPSAAARVDDRLYLLAELRRLPLPQREALVLFHMADWRPFAHVKARRRRRRTRLVAGRRRRRRRTPPSPRNPFAGAPRPTSACGSPSAAPSPLAAD